MTETSKLRETFRTMLTSIAYIASDKAARKFAATVKAKGNADTTPAEWVALARGTELPCRCGRCAGTGLFITGTVNGKPTGPGGSCYRCEGHGVQTGADVLRNYGYDVYGRAASFCA